MDMRLGLALTNTRSSSGGGDGPDTSHYVALRDGTLVTDRAAAQITIRET